MLYQPLVGDYAFLKIYRTCLHNIYLVTLKTISRDPKSLDSANFGHFSKMTQFTGTPELIYLRPNKQIAFERLVNIYMTL